ncbi:uncharacterized protein GIQ15_00378 [Arthroderma uncinatum]|uniref:uncharacterized protein n=1 Tax=Arthroderma uncinatum TaxID=74035 RepID=UPI00144AAF99|nr:uncharacterized protein GIQ15_00378 [Arthroderma uncinatum]KAF3490861.1 hypothetical protein GIQ15_00378 [Arthroderma uncinatum]
MRMSPVALGRHDPLGSVPGWSFGLALIIFSLSHGLPAAAAAAGSPAPLSVTPSTNWIGYDGAWSSLSIRVGTPAQWLEVIPDTGSSETWVIGRDGCDATMRCRKERGGLFLANASSTWAPVGLYELGNNLQLGDSGYGNYGYDAIGLNDSVSVPGQVISMITTAKWWIGSLGLGVTDTNFTDENKLPLLSSLVQNESVVPSHSYGYTAGAFYQMKGVPTSLTFGGFDRSRFTPNNVSFFLSPDNLPAVTIKSIKLEIGVTPPNSNSLGDGLTVDLASAGTFVIDSSTPFLWFPEQICDSLAGKLGLVYNSTLDIYTYGPNATTYDTIVNSNVSFKFTISDLPDSPKSVDITLPFSAFNHKLTYPFPGLDRNLTSEGLRYFPLRRTNDPKKLTIGRVFLQEAYLIVDYERRNFSISQATFNPDSGISMDLVAITQPLDSPFPGPAGENAARSLSTAAIVGVTIGVSVGVILISLCALYFFRRQRSKERLINEKEEHAPRFTFPWKFWRRPRPTTLPAELVADRHHPVEADDSAVRYELPACTPVELPASEVSSRGYGDMHKSADIDMEANGHGHHLPSRNGIQFQHIPPTPSDTYIVSPVGPSSTLGTSDLNNSLGIPSPIATSTNSTALSHSRPDSSPSLLASNRTLEEAQTARTGPSSLENPQLQEEPNQNLTRKFSWEQ